MSTRPFTPTQEQAEDLDRRTVGRDRLLAILEERLRLAATTGTRQHTLLVGPRGSGKTHLLQVALHRASVDTAIAGGIAIARVPEDAVGLTSYVDLLRECAASAGIEVGSERAPSALETALLEGARGRTLALVIENLDRVFQSLGEAGQRDLRSWVETSGRVLILAATPALFSAIRDRRMPWFGGLAEMPVGGLTAKEGRELLTILAADRGDSDLVDALKSDRGEARIRAVSQLTAGSPRIWMVFSDCLSVESLDELIPSVEGLVEGLVPYYQSLLWDLSGNQQAIVRQLAEGTSAALTASEIAARTGFTQQSVSKTLGVLKDSRWVRSMKMPDGDQRQTWYELREPMLRHHFQWRATGGEPLRLIVELLREWYGPTQLRKHLSLALPGSAREAYPAESLNAIPAVYDLAASAGTPEALRLSSKLLVDMERVLGPDHEDAVLCRRQVDSWSRMISDPSGVVQLLERARAGDPEASMRLPAELRVIAGPKGQRSDAS
jgi:DNA-binding transcriptional ArsR family regulator